MRLLFLRSVPILCLVLFCVCKRSPAPADGGFCAIGSAELNMLMDHWAAGFAEQEPGTDSTAAGLIHEGRGNSVAPGALLNGRCDMAPMSRKMTDAEIDAFVQRYGSEPVAIPVAVDALALVVPAAYKITTISPDDVFHLFHLGPDKVRTFAEETDANQIKAYGVNSASERYRWFKNVAVHGKKFSDRVIEVAGPLRLAEAVNKGGVGYLRLAEMDGDLKTLKIDMGFGKIVPITRESVRSGLYPFTRFFYIYLPPKGRPLDPRTLAFIDFVLSDDGQRVLEPAGLFTLARKERIYNANRLAKYRAQ